MVSCTKDVQIKIEKGLREVIKVSDGFQQDVTP